MQICKMSVKKQDFINAISEIRGNISAKGEEYISIDFKIGCSADDKLNDCIMLVAKRKGEYDLPDVEIARFRTLETHKVFMKQLSNFKSKINEVTKTDVPQNKKTGFDNVDW